MYIFIQIVSFEKYLRHVTHFNASGPFYYVLLYIQLVIVSPYIYLFLRKISKKRYAWVYELLGAGAVLVISSLTTNYTNILSVYGGGGKLFGGTYLFLLYLGMWFAKYYPNINLKWVSSFVLFIIGVTVTITWWRFIYNNNLKIDSYLPFGDGSNPPSVSFGIYSILIVFITFCLGSLTDCFPNSLFTKGFSCVSKLGKHTLYIFLYHKLFLDFFIPKSLQFMHYEFTNFWMKRVVYFIILLWGPICVEYILKYASNWIKESKKEWMKEEDISNGKN